jgi:hypothetical protein
MDGWMQKVPASIASADRRGQRQISDMAASKSGKRRKTDGEMNWKMVKRVKGKTDSRGHLSRGSGGLELGYGIFNLCPASTIVNGTESGKDDDIEHMIDAREEQL